MNKKYFKHAGAVLAAFVLCLQQLPVSAESDALSCSFSYTGFDTEQEELRSVWTSEGSVSAYVSAWQGERVFLKVKVTAEQDSHVSASVEPLSGIRQADQLSASVGLLAPVSASLGTGTDEWVPHAIVHDRITADTEADLAAGETAWFWISVQTNAESSGRYDGTVRISADREYELPIETVVTPLSLSGYEPSVDLWQYPYASYYYYGSFSEPFDAGHTAALREELRLYRQAGGSHITCTISEEPWAHQTYFDCPSLVKWNQDGSGNLWFDYSGFDAWVTLCEEEGITGPIDCFSILPFDQDITVFDDMGNPFRLVLDPGSETWRYYWENFLYSFVAHLNEKGWLDRTVMFVDERGIPYFQTAIDLVKSVPGGEQITFGAAVNVIPRDTALYDQIAYLSISIASVPEGDAEFETFLAHRKELGLTTTMYNCSTNYPNAFAISDPCESVWSMQYLTLRGFDGYLRWALNAWPQSPVTCADNPHFESGDTFLIYPDEIGTSEPKASPSVRLCMIEQGLNDMRKYQILQGMLGSEEAELLEQGLNSLYRYGGTYNAYGAMTAVSDERRYDIAEQSLRIEACIEKAALSAAMKQRGVSSFAVNSQLKDLIP